MGLKRISAPASPVVTTQEAKDHLVVDHTDHDTMIQGLVSSATAIAENYTQSSFFTQTWELKLDKFPSDFIELRRGPVASVTSVKYYNADNTLTTLATANYRVDSYSSIGRIEHITTWPSTKTRIDSVEVIYVCGRAVADIPEDIKSAIKLIVGHLYQNRQDVITGTQVNQIPFGAKALLDPYRVYYVAK
jgi:uncharacterized phiE125 gp8 family phage protein